MFTALLSAVQFRPLRAFLESDESAAEAQPDRLEQYLYLYSLLTCMCICSYSLYVRLSMI